MITNYYAHSKHGEKIENFQTIKEHSENVATMVQRFSHDWCAEDFAKNLGLLHDVGKYQTDFQKKIINNVPLSVQHSICGAVECEKYNMMTYGQYCIAGHHGGLPDIGTNITSGSLLYRLEQAKATDELGDYSAYNDELCVQYITKNPIKIPLSENLEMQSKELAFWTKMMYSCLVDADYLDTEEFCNGKVERGVYLDFSETLAKIKDYMNTFSNNTPIKQKRNELLQSIVNLSDAQANIWLLNMPTGSGKTLASMRFALERAVKTNKKHIIYVIPYTSIIEQNSRVFKDIFGEDAVLEHHSSFDYDSIENVSTIDKLKHSAENWDASIIVTTNVQFFESIYSNRSTKLRKLHNISDSIIVFDEIHTLSGMFYQPCLEAVKILTQKFGCEAIFMTATMPDFDKWLKEFGCNGLVAKPLIANNMSFDVFKRCKIENIGKITLEKLITLIDDNKSNLIIVNTKKNARTVYEKVRGEKYHLSTYMTPKDRLETIKKVKLALDEGRAITLVSTSLIEAGVDLDFDCVFRETAGLDNLLQSAGRCNREGRKDGCKTFAFSFASETMNSKDSHIKVQKEICENVLNKYTDVSDVDAVTEYFDRLYDYYKEEMNFMNFNKYIPFKRTGFDFASYATKFHLIDSNSTGIMILYKDDENQIKLMDALKYGGKIAKRKLQKYMVNLRQYEYEKLKKEGVILELNGVEYLANDRYYDSELGIKFEDESDYIF